MEKDISVLWENVLVNLQEDGVSDITFKTYISRLEPCFLDENTICIYCPTAFIANFCKTRLYETIRNTVIHLTNKDYDIIFKLEKEKEVVIENEVKVEYISPEGLNSKYTFENYITGPNNRFAHDIAKNIVDTPGEQFNPLFIYGGVGLGKTHLMQAIGHAIYQKDRSKNIVYATGEQFANDYISLMVNQNRNNSAESNSKNEYIRNKYRNADILLIDDIQFLVGKHACQEQFFYTFNALFETGKQIVITSEKAPKDIGIDERLKTRFDMGVSVDIKAPDFETRLAILRRKTEMGKYVIPDEILLQVATKVRTNIRELEGVFNKIVAYKTITKKELTVSVVDDIIESVLVKSASVLTSSLIMQVVAKFYSVKVEDLKSVKRSSSITVPRQIAMYLCRELANMSFANIGKEFGGKDHTTVLHAYTKVKDEIFQNKDTEDLVEDIKKALSIEN